MFDRRKKTKVTRTDEHDRLVEVEMTNCSPEEMRHILTVLGWPLEESTRQEGQ